MRVGIKKKPETYVTMQSSFCSLGSSKLLQSAYVIYHSRQVKS